MSYRFERKGVDETDGTSGWRRFGLFFRGRAVVKETANVRDVLEICKDHVALCKVNRAI